MRSSSSAVEPRRHLVERRLQSRPPPLLASLTAWFAALRAALPVSASIRRTPAATPLSETRDQADVAGAPHMRAAAQLDRPAERVAASPSPIATTRTSSPYFSPNSARAPEARASSSAIRRVVTGEFCSTIVVGDVLDLLDLLGASSAWDARSRSAAGRARPASPSARRDRRAPGAAPRAADASPNGCARIAPRRA